MNSLVQRVVQTQGDLSDLSKDVTQLKVEVHKGTVQYEKELKEVKKAITVIQGDLVKYHQDLKVELAETVKTIILHTVKDSHTKAVDCM